MLGDLDRHAVVDRARMVWPERNVRIITSFPAGTGGDISARLYAERLTQRWGKPVIVENKPGADGILAVMAVIGARDSHTLLYTNGGPITTNAFSHEKLLIRRRARPSSRSPRAPMCRSRYRCLHRLKIKSLASFCRLRAIAARKAQLGGHARARSTMSCRVFSRARALSSRASPTRTSHRRCRICPRREKIHLYVSALASQLGMVKKRQHQGRRNHRIAKEAS